MLLLSIRNILDVPLLFLKVEIDMFRSKPPFFKLLSYNFENALTNCFFRCLLFIALSLQIARNIIPDVNTVVLLLAN